MRPVAHIAIDSNGPRLDAVLDALIADQRALGPYGLGTGDGPNDSVFQVVVPRDRALKHATRLAAEILNAALAVAGIEGRCDGYSVVERDDPDRLP